MKRFAIALLYAIAGYVAAARCGCVIPSASRLIQ